jgi:hypothetical protein
MVRFAPSNAGGIGGRGRIATAKEIVNMNNFTQNYFSGGTNLLATDQQINSTPSPNLYESQEKQVQPTLSAQQGISLSSPPKFYHPWVFVG